MPDRIPMIRLPRSNAKVRRRESRPNAAARGYCDAKHKAWRLAVLLRDGYTCQHCRRACGGKREAHADHVIPVTVRPDLRYEVDNGRCLCHGCHSRRTLHDGSVDAFERGHS